MMAIVTPIPSWSVLLRRIVTTALSNRLRTIALVVSLVGLLAFVVGVCLAGSVFGTIEDMTATLSHPGPPVAFRDHAPTRHDPQPCRPDRAAAHPCDRVGIDAPDALAGLAHGHTSKLFCGLKGLSDLSLPALLDALGCSLVLIEDPAKTEASRRARDRLGIGRRRHPQARPAA
jgi:hypothetical protein